jgi:TetR/AcrR family transcriptional regulator, transcriptional repressor for nem operon
MVSVVAEDATVVIITGMAHGTMRSVMGIRASMPKLSTREKIVSAAADRFHALGYSACGVQEIVDAAGVPKGSFYNYFKAKELLAVEVLGTYWESVRIDMLADKGTAPRERIRGHFEHIASLYAGFGYERGCLIGKFVQELSETTPRIRQDVVGEVVRWIGLLASAIREGQADGSIARELDADKIARYLINSWGGAAAGMKIVKSRAPLDDFFSTTFSLLLPPSPGSRARRNPVQRRSVGKGRRVKRAAGRDFR